ncbi:hypothetical protein [Ruegeria arenilitoris]|uniref:hypothetical protein n=1 Tax=Ruegeria arenilitoris TaxID=1173585 RepID=UPI0014816872|nr:hypothetical protein [Ruegeria arenilitoris]
MYVTKFEKQFCAVKDIRKDEFARKFPLLDDRSVHAQWKKGSWQITRIGEIWKRTGKVFSVPYEGIDAYPSFQFAEDGTPLPLMETVLKALPADMTPWQLAYWMTSPKAELGGDTPAKSIQTGDNRVVDAAGKLGVDLLN